MKTLGLTLLFILTLSGAGYYALETDILSFGSGGNLPSATFISADVEASSTTGTETGSSGSEASDLQLQSTSQEGSSGSSGGVVISKGFVKPLQESKLSMGANGIVQEILVSEGASIEAGQVLVKLDNVNQLNGVSRAEAALRIAQAKLAELMSGARTEEVLSAEASVDAAKAQLARLSEQARPEDEAAAVAAIKAAEARLAELYKGPSDATLSAAQADLDNASAVLRDAQRAYDQVKWRNDIGMLPESQALEQSTNAYIAARSNYDIAVEGPKSDQIAAAQAGIESAKAQLAALRTPALTSDLDNARAELRRAEAELELVKSGVRSETISVAEAEVALAEVTLTQAKTDLARTELKAPFSGTIAQLNVSVGEFVSPGIPLIELGDLVGWQVETDNLLELDVVKLQTDAPAQIRINAIPDLDLTGRVKRIRRIGENKVGDITYTVIIALDEHSDELEWNMTATVTIEPL